MLHPDPAPGAAAARTEARGEPSRVDLPAPLTPLVARETERAELAETLRRARLVTVTGPGGVGKTRLAVEAARDAAADFPDGACFVDLSAVRGSDESEVHLALAERLGVRDDTAWAAGTHPDHPALWSRLRNALMTKRTLLVVDNCEQAVDAIAGVVEALVRHAPDLRVIATGREPLGIPGERTMPLRPWSFPDVDMTVDDPSDFGAYRLFEQLVTDAGGRFDDPDAAMRICRRLDGLPLALELAASRVRTMGLAEVDRRLDDRFRLLGAGARAGAERHRTLEAAIAWSWDLADERQRAALRRLSYAEDWTLESAEAIAGPDVDALETVPALVDRSLALADLSGRPRYRLLETVRAFGLERLRETGEEEATAKRHREYYQGLAEHRAGELRGDRQSEALEALRDESANLRLAIETSETPLDLVLPLMWFWVLTGRLTEARRHLRAGLAAAEPGGADTRIGRCWAETLRLRMADDGTPDLRAEPEAAPNVEGPLEDHARLAHWYLAATRAAIGMPPREPEPVVSPEDAWGCAASALTTAITALRSGDRASAAERAGRALTGFRDLGDRWGELQALDVLSRCAYEDGDARLADRFDTEAIAIAESLALHSDLSRVLSRMGRRALESGDLASAERRYGRARRIAGEQCDALVSAEAEGGLKAVKEARSAPVQADAARYLELVERCDFHSDSALGSNTG